MTSLLFPPRDLGMGAQKRLAYVTILSDIARGCSDSIDALSLFEDLVHGRTTASDSLGFMAFDAHVGDTGCQLRAGMIQDLFNAHRQLWSNESTGTIVTPLWLRDEIERLRATLNKARSACADLTKKKILPFKLGFGRKQDTPTNILSAIGWQEASPMYWYSEQDRSPINGRLEELNDLVKQWSFDMESTLSEECMSELTSTHTSGENSERSDVLGDFGSPQQSPASSRMSSITSDNKSSWGLQNTWSVTNPWMVVRFLVYAFVLSKYKVFCRLEKVIGARLNERAAAEFGTALVADWVDTSNLEYKPAKIQRITSEFRTLQGWLSDYSCAWVRSLSQQSYAPMDLYSLVGKTVQRSAKGLTAVACFPAYLLQREHWASVGRSLILIDRHFCPSGWHYNIFEARLSTPNIEKDACAQKGGLSVEWRLRQSSIEELIGSREDIEPHLIVMGNSIAGCYDEYMSRIASFEANEVGRSKVHEDECSDNDAHICDFVQADHDNVTLSFFADHEMYAFPLSSGIDEIEFFDSCIESFEDEFRHVQKGFRKSRKEAGIVGSGREGIHILGWQHMFIDTLPRLGNRLRTWKEDKNLMPLSAGCA